MRVHEASPTAAAIRYFRESGARYSWSCYSFDDSGQPVDPAATEDLESLSFPDASFDLFVSQDVFEHVNDPVRAFSEVARVLKPGGSHVFTVPWYPDRRTERAAETDGDRTTHFGAPEYHSDPFGQRGSLVFTRFGSDICRIIEEAGGMQTRVRESRDRRRGVVGDSLVVFHSRKPGMPENRS